MSDLESGIEKRDAIQSIQKFKALAVRNDLQGGAAYVGGKYVAMREATVSVGDWGFTRSDLVYDVVHVVDHCFFRLEEHLDRFTSSMKKRRLDIGMSRSALKEVLHRVVSLSQLSDAYVAMVALRGRPRVAGSRQPEDCANHLVAYSVPWIDVIPKSVQEQGARMWVAAHPRVPDASVDPTVKNYQWSDLTSGLFEAHDQGYDTVVLCDAQGMVTEGPGFNVFIVKGARVSTPDRGALHGITRSTVLALCSELGIPCSVTSIPRSMLEQADEVFVTSTAGGVMPVREVSGNPVAGPAGSIYKIIHDAYWAAHRDSRYTTAVVSNSALFNSL